MTATIARTNYSVSPVSRPYGLYAGIGSGCACARLCSLAWPATVTGSRAVLQTPPVVTTEPAASAPLPDSLEREFRKRSPTEPGHVCEPSGGRPGEGYG